MPPRSCYNNLPTRASQRSKSSLVTNKVMKPAKPPSKRELANQASSRESRTRAKDGLLHYLAIDAALTDAADAETKLVQAALGEETLTNHEPTDQVSVFLRRSQQPGEFDAFQIKLDKETTDWLQRKGKLELLYHSKDEAKRYWAMDDKDIKLKRIAARRRMNVTNTGTTIQGEEQSEPPTMKVEDESDEDAGWDGRVEEYRPTDFDVLDFEMGSDTAQWFSHSSRSPIDGTHPDEYSSWNAPDSDRPSGEPVPKQSNLPQHFFEYPPVDITASWAFKGSRVYYAE